MTQPTLPTSPEVEPESEPRTEVEGSPQAVEDCWDEPDLPDSTAMRDLESLQGVWRSASGRRRALLLVAGCRFTIHLEGGEIFMGDFELVPAAWPKGIDMRIHEGPRYRGLMAACIYELAEDALRWCGVAPGQERLPEFPTEDDQRYLCIVFRRETSA